MDCAIFGNHKISFTIPCDRLRTTIASFAGCVRACVRVCMCVFFVPFVKRKACGVMERRGGMEYGFERGLVLWGCRNARAEPFLRSTKWMKQKNGPEVHVIFT